MTTTEARGDSPIARVESILRVWDPIGVRPGVEAPASEYDSYAPAIVAMVAGGASSEEVAVHLGRISTEKMGLSGRPGRDLEIARAIVGAVRSTAAPWPPSLHDASLLEVRFDWVAGEVALRFRTAGPVEVVLAVTEVSALLAPRGEAWGRSASVLTTRFIDDDPDLGLVVEMQSGDALVVSGKVRRTPA